jgi:hypothetical protein
MTSGLIIVQLNVIVQYIRDGSIKNRVQDIDFVFSLSLFCLWCSCIPLEYINQL